MITCTCGSKGAGTTCTCEPIPSRDEEDYAALADEMNDADVAPWNEDDWDAEAVAGGKRYAKAHGLRWPPSTGDYDRYWERKHN